MTSPVRQSPRLATARPRGIGPPFRERGGAAVIAAAPAVGGVAPALRGAAQSAIGSVPRKVRKAENQHWAHRRGAYSSFAVSATTATRTIFSVGTGSSSARGGAIVCRQHPVHDVVVVVDP